MRLINVETMELDEFFDHQIPPYAILSHRWEKGEVTFQDYANPELRRKKAGFAKITGLCNLAKSMAIEYAWIDTCCIDKTNSTELSEALNSMFAWYKESQICYAYLSDVIAGTSRSSDPHCQSLSESDWFTRGWTLQELLAPRTLEFYDKIWQPIGTLRDRASEVEKITGIRKFYLLGVGDPVMEAPVAERFSWASGRTTTRTEDMAYCLLGLLDVNMPLLYGEGRKAFRRLQEEFMRTHLDLTLLTWGFMKSPQIYMGFSNHVSTGVGCLANTVSQFQKWNYEGIALHDPKEHHTTTNAGLLLAVQAHPVVRINKTTLLGFIPLDNVRHAKKKTYVLAIPLVWEDPYDIQIGPIKAQRADGNGPFWMPKPDVQAARAAGINESSTYLVSPPQIQVIPPPDLFKSPVPQQYYISDYSTLQHCRLDLGLLGRHGYHVADFYPPKAFQRPGLMGLVPRVHALLRFANPHGEDIFLLQQYVSSSARERSILYLGTAPESGTTWEHLLRPKYDLIRFRRVCGSFSWFSNVTVADLPPDSGILINVQEGFDSHKTSSIKTHVSLRVTGTDTSFEIPGNSDYPDNWSVAANKDFRITKSHPEVHFENPV